MGRFRPYGARLAAVIGGAVVFASMGSLGASVDTQTVTYGIPLRTVSFEAERGRAGSIATLKAGLAVLKKGQVGLALSARDHLPKDSLDWQVLTWAIAFSGGAKVPSAEIAAAAAALPDWPGASTLRRNSERALFREKPPAETVIRALGGSVPQTFEGTVLLTRAHLAHGDREAARAVLSPFWRKERLEGPQETLILREFGSILSSADQRIRMEAMLYAERVNSAKRVAGPAGAMPLWEAWSAAIRGRSDAGALLSTLR